MDNAGRMIEDFFQTGNFKTKCPKITCPFTKATSMPDIRKCNIGSKTFIVQGKEICGEAFFRNRTDKKEISSILFYRLSYSNCVGCELIGHGLIKQLHALLDGFITWMATAHNAHRIPSRNEPGRRFVHPVLRKLLHRPVLSSNCIVRYKCTYSSAKHLNIYTIFLYSKMFKSEIEGLLNNDGMPLSYITGHILS